MGVNSGCSKFSLESRFNKLDPGFVNYLDRILPDNPKVRDSDFRYALNEDSSLISIDGVTLTLNMDDEGKECFSVIGDSLIYEDLYNLWYVLKLKLFEFVDKFGKNISQLEGNGFKELVRMYVSMTSYLEGTSSGDGPIALLNEFDLRTSFVKVDPEIYVALILAMQSMYEQFPVRDTDLLPLVESGMVFHGDDSMFTNDYGVPCPEGYNDKIDEICSDFVGSLCLSPNERRVNAIRERSKFEIIQIRLDSYLRTLETIGLLGRFGHKIERHIAIIRRALGLKVDSL